ncbi:MAG: preprotein translocase subunit SecG [Holophaga sp.]|nr:preprotein translocase subunit SecG [Holophaga sp.]
MSGFLLTLHVIVSVLLVAVILLQPGAKGGGLGASFGGGGANSAFGAQGSAPFLAKFTYWLAAGVMATSLVIEVIIVKENRSVLDRAVAPVTVPSNLPPAPAAPTSAAPPATPAPSHAPAPATPKK